MRPHAGHVEALQAISELAFLSASALPNGLEDDAYRKLKMRSGKSLRSDGAKYGAGEQLRISLGSPTVLIGSTGGVLVSTVFNY